MSTPITQMQSTKHASSLPKEHSMPTHPGSECTPGVIAKTQILALPKDNSMPTHPGSECTPGVIAISEHTPFQSASEIISQSIIHQCIYHDVYWRCVGWWWWGFFRTWNCLKCHGIPKTPVHTWSSKRCTFGLGPWLNAIGVESVSTWQCSESFLWVNLWC